MRNQSLKSVAASRWVVHGIGAAVLSITLFATWQGLTAMQRDHALLQEKWQNLNGLSETTIRVQHDLVQNRLATLRAAQTDKSVSSSPADGEAEALGQLLHLAEQVDLSIKNFQPAERVGNGTNLHLTAFGSFASICRFLGGFDKLTSVFQVQQCEITGQGNDASNCTVEMKVRLIAPEQMSNQITSIETN